MTDDLDGVDPGDDAARADLDAIRRGLVLVAAGATPPPRRRWPVLAAVAAAAVAGLGLVVLDRDRSGPPVARPSATTPAPDTSLGFQIGAPTLADRVAGADRVVLGTVTRLDRGTLASGAPYLMVRVRVEESFKPPGDTSEAVILTDEESGSWRIGERQLYFLAPDVGPGEDVPPPHHALAERFSFTPDGRLDAPFTLDDLRAEAARQ